MCNNSVLTVVILYVVLNFNGMNPYTHSSSLRQCTVSVVISILHNLFLMLTVLLVLSNILRFCNFSNHIQVISSVLSAICIVKKLRTFFVYNV
jgi:hypothetical protein